MDLMSGVVWNTSNEKLRTSDCFHFSTGPLVLLDKGELRASNE